MGSPKGRNLRKGRWSAASTSYLITATTQERTPWFLDLCNGRILINCLRFSDNNGWTHTWAFVVMPDHLHWLVELGQERSLSHVVASIKKYSSRRISARDGQDRGIWQPGFHDHAIRQEEDLRAAARYVIMNPVRAGICRSVSKYSLWDAQWIS